MLDFLLKTSPLRARERSPFTRVRGWGILRSPELRRPESSSPALADLLHWPRSTSAVKCVGKEKCSMSAQENKAIARRWAEEVWSKGNFGLIEELVAPEYVARDAINPGR